jgi:hypothetical protein
MRRLAVLCVIGVMLVPGVALGQSPKETAPLVGVSTTDMCLTITGPVVPVTAESLTQGIIDGVFTIDDVGGACAELAGTPEPTLEPAADSPLPVEVVDAGFTLEDGDAIYAAVLRNPNPSTWVAQYMSVRLDFLDDNGDLVTTVSENVTLMPGQTGAVVGTASDARGAKSVEVVAENGEHDWNEIDYVPGELVFSQVKTTQGDYGPQTTGRIQSSFDDQLETVKIMSVYRNPAGKVIGGLYTYVDFVPAQGKASFKISAFSDLENAKIKDTEVYYQV